MQHKELNIPIQVVGAGSQPVESDSMALDYLPMPQMMHVFDAPVLMDDSIALYPAAQKTVDEVKKSLQDYSNAETNRRNTILDLSKLPKNDLNFINRFLGEGEVAIQVRQDSIQYEIQETVLTGVWRIAKFSGDQCFDSIEIGEIPSVVSEETFQNAKTTVSLPETIPDGVMNAPAILSEINAKINEEEIEKTKLDEAHVINLTLLPQTPEDLQWLSTILGIGTTVVLSRGYGVCRITSTQTKNTWWVQYFNSEDRLILNTLEITDIPVAAKASIEDLKDSAERFSEMIESVST